MGRRRRRKKRQNPKPSPALRALETVRREGSHLVEPRCYYAEGCGGCTWQEVDYAHQLELKRGLVRDAFASQGLEVEVAPTTPSPRVYDYRNKMEFTFSDQRWLTASEIRDGGEDLRRDFALGMFGPKSMYKVIDIEACPLQSERANELLRATRRWALARGHAPFRAKTREGLLRFVVIRHARATDQTLLLLVTSVRDEALMRDFAEFLAGAGLSPTCLANGVVDSHQYATTGMEICVDAGAELLEDALAGLRFQLAPDAFFQVNPSAAEELVGRVLACAGLEGQERALDLYCGAGTLSLPLAQRAGSVLGLEASAPAIESARRNAALNGLEAEFAVCDLNAGLPPDLGAFDLVVTDPPRPGMHPRLLRGLARLAPPRLVSVGCKPGPQAENCAYLVREAGYRLEGVWPVDLFPHGHHVEAVALLTRG